MEIQLHPFQDVEGNCLSIANFNCGAVGVFEWIPHFMLRCTYYVISYSCWD